MTDLISIDAVKSRLLTVRGQATLLDRDVAALYGVETREVNQAVRNNPDKFPQGYVVDLVPEEVAVLMIKIFDLRTKPGKGHHSKHGYKVFTERGLYMLATVLKSKQATAATLAIVEAYAQLKSMVRDMEALQSLKDGSPEQAKQLTQTKKRGKSRK